MNSNRYFGSVIKEAELKFRPPNFVFDFLKNRASLPRRDPESLALDMYAELALVERKDELINLGLAKYARHAETLQALFFAENTLEVVKLSVLQNQAIEFGVLGGVFSGRCNLFGDMKEAVEWINSAPDQALAALFTNPNIGDKFLAGLFEQKEPWSLIDDARLTVIVRILGDNKRMKEDQDVDNEDDLGGYVESIDPWALCASVPVTDRWASALSRLLPNLPVSYGIKTCLGMSARWQIEESDGATNNEERKHNERGFLSDIQIVRMELARVALGNRSVDVIDLVKSSDIAFRCAAYSYGELTEQQMLDALEKEPKILSTYAFHNVNVWKRKNTRGVLECAVKIADDWDGIQTIIFWDMHCKHSAENPEWFDDENFKNEYDTKTGLKKDETKPSIIYQRLYSGTSVEDSQEYALLTFEIKTPPNIFVGLRLRLGARNLIIKEIRLDVGRERYFCDAEPNFTFDYSDAPDFDETIESLKLEGWNCSRHENFEYRKADVAKTDDEEERQWSEIEVQYSKLTNAEKIEMKRRFDFAELMEATAARQWGNLHELRSNLDVKSRQWKLALKWLFSFYAIYLPLSYFVPDAKFGFGWTILSLCLAAAVILGCLHDLENSRAIREIRNVEEAFKRLEHEYRSLTGVNLNVSYLRALSDSTVGAEIDTDKHRRGVMLGILSNIRKAASAFWLRWG